MLPSNPIMIAGLSNSGTVTSVALDASHIMTGSVQAYFTDGAAAGTLTLQGSNDTFPPVDSSGRPVPVHWDTVKNGSISATATVASGALTTISMQWLNYRWLRVSWVSSGGAGTFTVNGSFQGA